MTEETPDDRELDNRVRRRGSRYALWGAIGIGVVLATVLVILLV